MPLDVDHCPFMPVPKKVIFQIILIHMHINRSKLLKESSYNLYHVEILTAWHYQETVKYSLGELLPLVS